MQFTTLAIRNRVAVAPMSRVSAAAGGVPTSRMATYYETFARGGFGLVMTEGIYTASPAAQAYERQPGLVTTAQVDGWRVVTERVHEAGGVVVAQLMHAGALSQTITETIAPSAVMPLGRKLSEYGGEGAFPLPRAMARADIEHALDGFARSARLAREAGFDAIEIHGANGYLVDQFLTAYTNARDDEFGGAVVGRVRFAVDAIRRVRDAVGTGMPVGIRLSQTKVNDLRYRWPGGEADAEVIFAAVRDAGVSYVHLASEGRDWSQTSRLAPSGATITEVARRIAGVPVIANGGLDDVERAERILHAGQADAIALARGALANPDWPNRVRDGRPLAAFDGSMIHPSASLEHADAWAFGLASGR